MIHSSSHPSVYLSELHPLIYMSTHPSVHHVINLSIPLSLHLLASPILYPFNILPLIHYYNIFFITYSVFPLSIHPSVWLSIHLSIFCPSIHFSIHPSFHLSTYPPAFSSNLLSLHPSLHTCRSFFLSILLFLLPSIHLSTYPSFSCPSIRPFMQVLKSRFRKVFFVFFSPILNNKAAVIRRLNSVFA